MTDKQESKQKMYIKVNDFLAANFDFDAESKLKEHYLEFHSAILELSKNVGIQETDISGYAERKHEHKTGLANIDYEYSAGLRSFANDTDNTPLYNEFDLAVSKIAVLSDLKIVEYSNSLLSQLNTYKKEVEPYGVSGNNIDNLNKKTLAYSDLLLEPQKHKDQLILATQKIKKIMQSIDQILERSLDLDMEADRTEMPDRYKGYHKAREIYDAQTTHKSIIGTVTDADSDCDGTEDGCALAHVKVIAKFKPGKAWKEMDCVSTAKGNYQFVGIPDGLCTLTFTHEKYEAVTKEITVYSDKATKLDVEMKKTSKIV